LGFHCNVLYTAGLNTVNRALCKTIIESGLGSLECFAIINCTEFGQLILRKIIKIVAIRCQILTLKCMKSFVSWGCALDLTREAYSVPPDLAGF